MSANALSDLRITLQKYDSDSFANDGERNQALLAVQELANRLETPWDKVCRLGMTEGSTAASLKIARDLKLFEVWQGQGRQTSATLAKWTRCNEELMHRILRHLAATGNLTQPSPGVFAQTEFSLSLLNPVFGAWIDYLFDAYLPCHLAAPAFIAANGYQPPMDQKNGIFQQIKNCPGEDIFQYYQRSPRESLVFNDMMGGVMALQASWLSIYPHERLVEGSFPVKKGERETVLVDVGGGVGRDLERFRAAHPETAEKLVLQDMENVVAHAVCGEGVKVMAHDFFQKQPVRGARAYYLHAILHDWSDAAAHKILQAIRPAMTPGKSRLLLHEHVIPDMDPHPQATSYDLTMMTLLSGMERSETQWRELTRSAGFKVVEVWKSPLARQGIVECVVE